MENFDIDQHVEKIAAEKGVTPLAKNLGVKLAAAEEMWEGVRQQAYFDKLAQAGHAPQNEEEARMMLEFGLEVDHQLKEAASQSNLGQFKAAMDSLGMKSNSDAPEASNQEASKLAAAVQHTAQYVDNVDVAKHMLSIHDARDILNAAQ